jgi:hypothetical protein
VVVAWSSSGRAHQRAPPTDAQVVAGTILGITSMSHADDKAARLEQARCFEAPSTPLARKCAKQTLQDGEIAETPEQQAAYDRCLANAEAKEDEPPPARVTVAPPYAGPPPIGWVYGHTQFAVLPHCSMDAA